MADGPRVSARRGRLRPTHEGGCHTVDSPTVRNCTRDSRLCRPLPIARSRDMHELPSIDDLLEHMVPLGASDLHATAGSPPAFRARGHIVRAAGVEPFTAADT